MTFQQIKQCKQFIKNNFENWSQKVIREEYGRGGLLLHRGYYCPSLVERAEEGEKSVGTLLKRAVKRPDFIFGYDKENRLISVKSWNGFASDYDQELIYWIGTTEYGITVSGLTRGLLAFSEIEYQDGKMQKYFYAWFDDTDPGVPIEEETEEYEYQSEEIIVHTELQNIFLVFPERATYLFSLSGNLRSFSLEKTTSTKAMKEDIDSRDFFKEKPSINAKTEIPEIMEYDRVVRELFINAEKNVVYEKYGRGGIILNRGFFCPSLIIDIVIRGGSRGKLLKRVPRQRPDYVFKFDKKNRLVLASNLPLKENEVIFWEGDEEVGLTISERDGNNLCAITKSQYADGLLQKCSYYRVDVEWEIDRFQYILLESREEKYTYEKDRMKVETRSFLYHGKKEEWPPCIYDFVVKDDRLISYTGITYQGKKPVPFCPEGDCFQIKTERYIRPKKSSKK